MRKLLHRYLGISCLIFLNIMPVNAQQYNVYTPEVYKQQEVIQSPRGRAIKGNVIELLVDYSGSMGPWIILSKETLEYILPKLPQDTYVALRVVGGRGIDYQPKFCQETKLIVNFQKNNREDIINGLQDVYIGGNTPLTLALKDSVVSDLAHVSTLRKNSKVVKNKKIILVTDGYENCGANVCEYVREVLKARKDIQIDVILVGPNTNLMCLTAITGGRFYKIYKVKDQRKVFINAFEAVFDVPAGTVPVDKVNNLTKEDGAKVDVPKSDGPSSKGYKFINY